MAQRKNSKVRQNPRTFIDRFAATLPLPEKKPKRPIVIAPAGPSCVGKTTVMKFIERKLPYFVRIANDDLRLFLRRKGFQEDTVEKIIYGRPAYALAEKFLKRGYAVIIDANFATKPRNTQLLRRAARKFRIAFFVLHITAPPAFIKKKLKAKRFFKNGLLPNWRVAWDHFERSSRQFDYEKLKRWYIVTVDTSRPLGPQLAAPIRTFAAAMKIKKTGES